MTAIPVLKPLDVEPIPRLALRQNEAAQALGVSDRTLRDWAKKGDGPPCVVRDGVRLYPVDGLREWLAAKCEN